MPGAADTPSNFPGFPTSGFDQANRVNRFSGAFPDPYLDYASTQMPRSIYDVLRWSEYVYLTFGTYRMAVQRVVRYFLTKIELSDAGDDEKKKYEEFLDDHLHIMRELALIGDDFMAYGNAFISLRVPFRRYLACPKCKLERPINKTKWSWHAFKFHADCPCGYKGEHQRIDRRTIEEDKLKIVRWSAHEIKMLYCPPPVDKTIYFWDIPGWMRGEVRKGNTFYLENLPWEIIETIKSTSSAQNCLFRFHDDVIYHMRESTLSGMRIFGWGVPRIMGNFKQAWYIQVLKRYNEAIALDYIIPFRIVTPKLGTSREADPILHQNMSLFQAKVLAMFRQHRRDPTTLHMLPFPVDMAMLGAEGKPLAPFDLMDKGIDEFLNAQGVPAEMYRGTMQWQAMPAALRLFERTWVHLVDEFNHLINWIFKACSDLMNWENLTGRLQPVTLADDIEKKQIQLQLAAGQQISRQTAWAPFNISFREEIKRVMQEQAYEQEEMAKFQEEQAQKQEVQAKMQMGAAGMQQPGMQPGMLGQPGQPGMDPNAQGQQQGGQPAQGGQPMQPGAQPGMGGGMPMGAAAGGSGSTGVTPEDMMAQAEQLAMQLLGMPAELRRSELIKIKKANATLHSLVISKMQEIRQQAKTQGGYAMLQQTVGAGAAQ